MRRSVHVRFPVGAAGEVAAICRYEEVLRRVCQPFPTEWQPHPGHFAPAATEPRTERRDSPDETLRSAVA
jgi:hypothetical protein